MTHPLLRARLAAVAALAGIATTVAGAPLALAWAATRPVSAPAWALLSHGARSLQAFGRPIDGGEVVVAVVVLGAAAWTWIMVCLVVDATARVRGVAPPRLPASASLQRLVGIVVGLALTVAMPVSRAGALLPGSGAPPARHAAPLTVLAGPGGAPAPQRPIAGTGGMASSSSGAEAVAMATAGGASADGRIHRWYTVRPGDTLWGIAAAQLGNALQWRAIAAANLGRAQPDGQCLRDDHWIVPGWTLVIPIPAGSTASSSWPASGSAPTAASAIDALAPPTVGATGAPAAPTTGLPARGAPAVPTTGAAAVATAGPAMLDASAPQRDASTHPTGPEPELVGAAGRNHRARPRGSDGVVTFAELSLIAGAVVAALDRMRRVQQRHRRTGLRIALPTDDLAALELDLRRRARGSPRPALDALYRAACSTRGHAAPVNVAWARVGEGRTEVGIVASDDGASAALPPPFVPGRGGDRWILPAAPGRLDDADRSLHDVGAGEPVRLPATVVTAGRTGSDLVVVDLAVVGVLAVDAPAARAICRAMVVELATGAEADDVDVVVVGDDGPLAALERVRAVDDVARVLPMLSEAQTGAPVPGRSPLDGSSPPITVVVVLDADPRDRAATMALADLALASEGRVAVVVAGSLDSPCWHLCRHEGDTTLHRPPAGTAAHPAEVDHLDLQQLDESTVAGIAALIDSATPGPGVEPTAPPYGGQDKGGPPTAELPSGLGDLDEGKVHVRILGPVDVVGAERPFSRAWTLDLLVYLALHRGGATTDQWSTALWPDRLMAPATLHSTASATRRALGRDADGHDHLPRSHGRLRIGAGVVTDWELLQRWAATDDPEAWRRALALVRGRPLDGLRVIDWAILDGLLPAMEAAVVDLAERSGQRCLDGGDASGATWAARRGLLVCPYDERLYRVLLRAADMAGNPAAVEAAMAELVRLVAEDVEPYDAVHPETLELYRALSRHSVRATS